MIDAGCGAELGKVKKLAEPKERVRSLSTAERERPIEAMKKSPARLPIRFMLATGMRRANVTGMRWSWVDEAARVVVVPALHGRGQRPVRPRGPRPAPRGSRRDLRGQGVQDVSDDAWDGVERRFIFFSTQTPYVRAQIEIHATGSSGSMKNIWQDAIRELRLQLPGLEELAQITSALRAHELRTRREVTHLQKLRRVKRGLMEDLLTGRVRVTALLDEAAE